MASIAASSSKSSTSSISRGSRGAPRPRSPPSMYVSWAVPPPKQPKPLPKLEKKKNKSTPSLQSQTSSTSRSLFPSFSRRKGSSSPESFSKGKAKATSPVEDMTARPPPVVDSSSDSSMTPSSSRSGYDSSVTSATSAGSFASSLPASPSIDHITTPPQASSDGVTPTNLSASSSTEATSRGKSTTASTPVSGHHDTYSAEASSSFGLSLPLRLKQRTSAEELNHRRSRSLLVKRRSSMLLSSSVTAASPVISEFQSPLERIGKPISTSHNDTPPPHTTWYRSSSRSAFRSDETYHPSLSSPDATAGSSRGHNRGTSTDIGEPFVVIHSSTNVSHGSVSEASKESLFLEPNEAPMTFAGQASTSPTVSRTRAASGSRSEHSHSPEASTMDVPATPRSVSASQSTGTGSTPQPVSEAGSQDDHHAGHRTGQGGSISVRPGSPFDGLIPPITSIIHKKQDPARRQLTPTLNHPAGTVRRHAEHGWMGEWNRSNMDDVISSLRTLK